MCVCVCVVVVEGLLGLLHHSLLGIRRVLFASEAEDVYRDIIT